MVHTTCRWAQLSLLTQEHMYWYCYWLRHQILIRGKCVDQEQFNTVKRWLKSFTNTVVILNSNLLPGSFMGQHHLSWDLSKKITYLKLNSNRLGSIKESRDLQDLILDPAIYWPFILWYLEPPSLISPCFIF